jgi:bifunctional oligoribonuclease and PAP phosphatase NrnA
MHEHYPEHKATFQKILKALKGQKVVVLGHLRPDGDCIGSQIAITRGLIATGIDAIAVHEDPIPQVLQEFIDDTPFIEAKNLREDNYVALYVDCADPERVGVHLNSRFAHVMACIDHHISNPGYAYHNIIDSDSAATAQILTKLFLDSKIPIDPVTAAALYLGILTDTGQFQHGTTSAEVFELAAQLVRRGARPEHVSEELYERESLARIHLRCRFMETLKLELDEKVCIGLLTQTMYRETKTTAEDAEGLVDIARSIDGVCIGVSLEEQTNGATIKGSLRAKNPHYRVDHIARLLGGGGHVCAAGFKIDGTLEHFYPRMVSLLQKHLESIG